MKNDRKFKRLHFAMLVLIVACIAVLAGCSNGEVSDIAIGSSDMPRLEYVQGQDLDLSSGVITAMIDGKATSVPMNAEGVTVTGYDKNQLGKQTLTVSYKGKTTTLEITVVARMTVENYETNYFIGDSFDVTKGRVKILEEDGRTININLDNPTLTVTGFDSSKAGTVTVSVSYENANGESYQAAFDVVVYGVGEVTFTKPSKKAYQSHEEDLNLTGGYFTVTAEGNSALTKLVPITAEMVSGFDPSAATAEHREQPLTQTLTVSYAGKTFEYDISILYGAVSLIEDTAKTLEGLDWSGPVTLTQAQGEAAIQAIAEYLELSKSNQTLVDEEALELVVRPAVQYLCELFAAEAEKFSDSFTLDETGSILFVGKTYEQLAADTEKLADEDELFNVYAALLREVKEAFADMQMYEDVTVEDHIAVASEEEVDFCVDAFNFLMRLHDTLKEIPDDWQVEDLAEYEDQINTAIYLIQANGMIGPNFSYIFDVLANWRTNNDYFDIIYAYYCYVAEDGASFLFDQLWQKLPLPGRLQDWYLAFYNAVLEAQYMEKYGNSEAYLRDTTNFMYYYFEALSISEEIKNGDNQFYKDIYEIIYGDAFMDQNVTSVAGGYVAHSGGLVVSEAYNNLWKQYLEVVRLYTDGTFDPAEDKGKVEAVFNALADLGPAEVFGFLSSLKYLYAESGGTYLVLDYADNANNTFVYILANHYMEYLPEAARPMFQQMLLAMENYALHCVGSNATKSLESFKAAMVNLGDAYSSLSDADRTAFDDLLGECYEKYLKIYQAIESPKDFVFDQETQEQIDQFREMMDGVYQLSVYISDQEKTEQERQSACTLLYALYEKADALYHTLLSSGNEDVITLLHTKKYASAGEEETLETSFLKTRNLFVWYMYFGVQYEQKDADGNLIAVLSTWAVYQPTQLSDFLLKAVDLLWAGYNGTTAELDADYVASVAAAFRQLDSETLSAFYLIGISRYFDSMQAYLHGVLADDVQAQELATAILEVEFGYVVYEHYGHRESEITYFQTQFEEAKAIYEQVEDPTACDEYLKEMYDFYLALYNSFA